MKVTTVERGLVDLSTKKKKRQLLRNNEYYDMQDILDNLYSESNKGKYFQDLYKIIVSKENILMAYRNIKKNRGSKTAGTDRLILSDIVSEDESIFVKEIQRYFANYKPKSVRRVEIPKPDGTTRPLGIPCIHDRLIQQCIKQVLEPICEAKFHIHSYGFRPNRGSEHALARAQALINNAGMNYVVDIDIKGFFDNVNHNKLMKQLWTIGIRDKRILSIIRKILGSEIEGIGIPTKGTPQGGIISPLLSNIVLNELDWWISSQWETYKTNYPYKQAYNKYHALRSTKLKEIFIVRYADDFKIFCRDYKTAKKIYTATKDWLKTRLKLDISPTKSKVTNLRKNYTEFLGIRMKAVSKKTKFTCKSRMTKKGISKVYSNLVNQVKAIQKNPVDTEVQRLNSMIIGVHNYYRVASHISIDMSIIDFKFRKVLYNRLKNHLTNKDCRSKLYKERYGKYNHKLQTIGRITIFPVFGCINRIPKRFTQEICNYTKKGRSLIHNKVSTTHLIEHLLRIKISSMSVELYDNSISLIAGQMGKCYVTNEPLQIGHMEIHHIKMKSKGGNDSYENLAWVSDNVHRLIHSTQDTTISKYKNLLCLDDESLKKLNKLRKLVGNDEII